MKSSWDGLRRSFIERTHALNDALSRTAIADGDDARATRASASSDDDGTTTRDDDDEGRRATTPGALLKRALRRGTKRATPTRETGRYADADDAAEDATRRRTTTATVTRGTTRGTTANRVFVAMRVIGGDGACRGRRAQTMSRSTRTRAPVWNTTRDLRCEARFGDALCVDLYAGDGARGVERATLIARGQVSVQHALANEGAEVAVPMYDKLERATSPATVHVALRTRDLAETRASKRIFYVRHGESKWNEAQRDINIANMMRFDHPLTLFGVQQAQALGGRAAVACSQAQAGVLVHANVTSTSPPTMSPPSSPSSPKSRSPSLMVAENEGSELCESYGRCTTCYVSPLTRAVQTACFMLQSHPLTAQGVMRQVCLQSIREIKGVGGLDTVGIEQGDGVLDRAKKKLAEIVNDQAASRLGAGMAFDPNDAIGQWWTSETDSDNAQDVEARIYDFLETMRLHDADDAVIVVGHSLFLQQLVAKIIPKADDGAGISGSGATRVSPDPFDAFKASKDPFTPAAATTSSDPFAVPQRSTVGPDDIPFVPSTLAAAPKAARIENSHNKGKVFEKLINQKLCNAGCVALDVTFDAYGRATLENASLLFGSKFV